MCRYIVDPQSEGVLLPTRGTEANMHQRKYKISSHVQAFLKQFAQWRSEKQFEAAGPWRLLAKSNSKLGVQCKQGDMTGGTMFQAMHILAPDAPVPSVSCALPSPKSLAIAFPPQKPTSVSAGGLLSSKSKAAKSKGVDKVMCTYCGEMFGKQGIRNHEAKCAEKAACRKGWGQHKYQPWDDGDYNGDDDDNFDLFNSGHQGSKRTTFRTQPSPSATLSAAGDAPNPPEQLLAATQKELKALKKQQQKALQQQAKPVLQSSSDSSSSSSSNSSPEKKKEEPAEEEEWAERSRATCQGSRSSSSRQKEEEQEEEEGEEGEEGEEEGRRQQLQR